MSELTTELLRSTTPQELNALLPAAVWVGDFAGVVLRTLPNNMVELYLPDYLTPVSMYELTAVPITDTERCQEVLRAAVKYLATVRQEAIDRNDALRLEHASALEQIRDYAIERHEAADICRAGLDRFLDEFGFEPYHNRLRVNFTLTGSYVVDNSNDEDVCDDASKYLRPDLSDLDHVDEDSTHFDLEFSTSVAD